LLRNDLEAPARQLVPEIALISDLLRDAGANLVRMSGSGATCFGIFASDEVAEQAAEALSRLRPNWYFAAVKTRAGDAYVAH
jgi:4-diphosphocytidyl-2-C-methyl-D-erythritol kinase